MPMHKTEVLAFTTAAIHAAAALVGDGGVVEFPRGVYDSDGLQVLYPNQTWIGEYGTIIKRNFATLEAPLWVKADGLKLRNMEIDCNRYVNLNLSPGISITNYSLDMEWVHLHSANHWGLSHSNGYLRAVDCQFDKTGQAGIFWRIGTGPSQQGPHIDHCGFSRQLKTDYIDSGCIIIAGVSATKRVIAPRIINSRMVCYNPNWSAPKPNNSGGAAFTYCNSGVMQNNEVIGGRIGLSVPDLDYGSITGNMISGCASYAIELPANACDNSVMANTMSNCGTGVEISGTSARNKIIGNPNHGCKIPVRDGAGLAYHNLIWGN